MDIKYDHLKSEDRVKWRFITTACLMSLPKREREVLPEIKIYPTLIASIADNFDIYNEETDNTVEDFIEGGVWAYSRINSTSKEKRFMSFSLARQKMCFENIPPEITVFHEIGHFMVQDLMKERYTAGNMKTIEKKCDRYGLYSFIRMLYFFPRYTTPFPAKKYKKLEAHIREMLAEFIHNNMSEIDKRYYFARIAQQLYDKMGWDTLYDKHIK